MALVFKDRVQESTTTTGTGTVTLAGATTGFQSFSVIGNGNTTYYTLVSDSEWEVGIGTYTASGTTLSRDNVLESSNSGSKITLSGTSNVFCTYPAEKAVVQDSTNTGIAPQIGATNGIFVNNSIIGADYIIPTSYNAMSVNATVASGVSVTVPASSKWVIL
tara:strand:+ start:853 stop:1338 length:486 start_codon:yes stop_codon:yes gene_type:complete